MLGRLYGLGVGPGDPELITVKAARILQESSVIAFPKKRDGHNSYAYYIVDTYIDQEEKEMLGLIFPMTKDPEELNQKWSHSVEQIWEKLAAGKDVAFVTEGDPLLFSTFIFMMNLMRDRHPEAVIEIVPGITSMGGAAARLGIPLADGEDHVAIIPACDDYDTMKKAINDHDCIVFIKVAKVKDLMLQVLKDLNLLDRAYVVTKVTSEDEIIWKTNELAGVELEYLSLMVVRK
ncbi:precorrin-2 C(20)-methyltransferase [Neobacillus sp. YIM B02564]|uniref:Precorrin-2 C(20)-methyltransferase n=1 Tax=Neobacillus paridis TaxID=2803862 RepID=A0ABS1TLW0_9BACI|nr:precorrin-2 C(20)-methyltransferase [Neobacillus paridis]MBL4952314.1 precorrin-2 C(20)-methyltransferase [Neobacillus paridis]